MNAYLAVSSQWRVTALASGHLYYVGLDYTAARVGLAAARIRVTPELWDGIRVMETETRAVLNAAGR